MFVVLHPSCLWSYSHPVCVYCIHPVWSYTRQSTVVAKYLQVTPFLRPQEKAKDISKEGVKSDI